MKTMQEVLAEHQWYDATTDNEDPATGCTGCDDWFGSEDALDDGTFAAHQAAALSAAGFGLVADAKAEALLTMADRLEKARDMTWNGSMRKVNGWASAADFIRQHAEQADPS